MRGVVVSDPGSLEDALRAALDLGLEMLLLDGTGSLGSDWPEVAVTVPDFGLLRDAVRLLRQWNREEEIDLIWFGGVRSGTDAAKLIGMGAIAVVQGVAAGLAAGAEIGETGLSFSSGYDEEDRTTGLINLLQANAGEASMMARCTGKTVLHNIEPEDLRAITKVTADATGIPMPGTQSSAA